MPANEFSAWDALSDEALETVETGLTLEKRIQQLEDALLVVVRRLAMLEWQMEAIDGESSTPEM